MEQISTWVEQHQINVTGIIATVAFLLGTSITIVLVNRLLQDQ